MFHNSLYAVQSRELLAFAIALILFAIGYAVLFKFLKNKGISLIIAFIISFSAGWFFYINNFFGWESTLAVVIYILILGIIAKIFWAVFKGFKKIYRR